MSKLCPWFWSHKWSKWQDIATVKKSYPWMKDGAWSDEGIEQSRRCEVCGALERRVAWLRP